MIQLKYLGNGSSGNATSFSDGETEILIDNGLPLKRLPTSAHSILVSHAHSDHISGIARYAKKYGIRAIVDRIFLLEETEKINSDYLQYEDFYSTFYLNSIEVEPFGVWHDEPCFGFMLNKEYLHLTDTGKIPFTLLKRIEKYPIKVLYMECNYDEDMIIYSGYDYFLKKRIEGRYGHLSNQDVVSFLASNADTLAKIDTIVLGHLSENTNSVEMLQSRIDDGVPESISGRIKIGKDEIHIV
jgi:phosphoribosyl 1,2-cyclic phosphodiesterase